MPSSVLTDASEGLGTGAGEDIERDTVETLSATPIVLYADPTNNDDIDDLADGDILTPALVTRARTILKRNNAKKFSDGLYRMGVSPEQIADLQESDAWQKHAVLNAPKDLEKGEVGIFRGFKFIESNMLKSETNTGGVTVQHAIAFGEKAYNNVDVAGYDINKPKVIIKRASNDKTDKSDPLNQRSTAGIKCFYTGVIVEPLAVIDVMTTATGA
jgi:N4-gp56 family major capsid protein